MHIIAISKLGHSHLDLKAMSWIPRALQSSLDLAPIKCDVFFSGLVPTLDKYKSWDLLAKP